MISEQARTNAHGSEPPTAIKGRCLCGDIRYEITGPIFDVVHCHCESCRRHTSTAFATFFNVERSDFHITQGTLVRYTSSPDVVRTHCGRCGSPITFENPHELSLYACSLEDLTLVKPEAHIMVGEMLPWLNFGDDLPCFEKGIHGGPPICHGLSQLPKVSFESVRANSKATNAARDTFGRK